MAEIVTHPKVNIYTPEVAHECCSPPALALLKSGEILMLYSGPVAPHGQPAGATSIYGRKSGDGGRTWEPERVAIHRDDTKALDPALLYSRDGALWCFYLAFDKHEWRDGNPTEANRSDVCCASSPDEGETWTDHQMIFQGYCGATRGAIQTASGALVVPISYMVPNPGRLLSACVVSRDGGQSWSLSEFIDLGGAGNHDGALEPTVIQLRDGRVWMLIRTSHGRFFQSFSQDDGLSWSEAVKSPIRSPSAPGHLERLASGRIALVWNHTVDFDVDEPPPHKFMGGPWRRALHLALSEDEGRNWTPPVEIARAIDPAQHLRYPFVFEAAPGELLIACAHRTIDGEHIQPVVFGLSEEILL